MIRAIRETDAAACAAIYNPYVLHSVWTMEEAPLTAEDFTARIRKVTAGYPWLAEEQDGRILGYAYLSAYRDRAGYRYSASLSIYVDECCQGMGVGRRLYEALEAQARQQGLRHIIAVITDLNEESRRFHEKHGFVFCGCMPGIAEKLGQPIGVCHYVKHLT